LGFIILKSFEGVNFMETEDKTSSDLYIGVDIGGTFTDFVIFDPNTNELTTSKRLSTPTNPAQAVIEGLKEILADYETRNGDRFSNIVITHGSTVATNALLEKKGARIGLVTTKGFRDVIQIGRQDRPELYNLAVQPRAQLVPKHLRFEVLERIDHRGEVLIKLSKQELKELIAKITSQPVESIAVCLLFSFLFPEHEKMIAEELRNKGFFVSVSSEILPEYREYERTSTTVVNAYVTPILDRYLADLEESLFEATDLFHMRIMQSNGGIIGLREARKAGVRCIFSGPAGGVVGASHIGRMAKISNPKAGPDLESNNDLKLITFDMGGTSTDVSLVDQRPVITTESIIAGYPISIPMLDIHTIGAGGGSIAKVDRGGALRVGPESAGADPGPACYARGKSEKDLPTVTDANVVLGRLPVDHFLGGKIKLDRTRAHDALAKLGRKLGLNTIQTARGVIEVINAHMERALRLVSVERGFDPQDFVLLSFGGAGSLHACELAAHLGIPKVVVPPLASTLSAFGMLAADVIKDYSQTRILPGDSSREILLEAFEPFVKKGIEDIQNEGFIQEDIHIERALDMRYRGQSYELTIPYSEDILEDFHHFHEKTYGYSRREAAVEIVNIRLRATGKIEPPSITAYPPGDEYPTQAYLGDRAVFLTNESSQVPLYQGELLASKNSLSGPAIIVRKDTTIFLTEKDSAIVDAYKNLVITVSQ
jgi:N-methylhydantoinase A